MPKRAHGLKVGSKSHRLTMISYEPRDKKTGREMAKWECDCGTIVIRKINSIACGNTKSCGCLGPEATRKAVQTHGMSNSREYWIWRSMHKRCYNPKYPRYYCYGAKGVSICGRWRGGNGFANFYSDMGPRPSREYSIERINVFGNYEPSNCKWIPIIQQAQNKRNAVIYEINGEKIKQSELVRRLGVKTGTIIYWRKLGKTGQEIFDHLKSKP